MKRNLAIRRLFAILMIAGLTLAPISRPVMAETSPHASIQEMSVTMDETANDMLCCPSKVPVGCDKCVFMAACTCTCFTGMPLSVFHPFPIVSGAIARQQNEAKPDGLAHPPPEHPPRTLV